MTAGRLPGPRAPALLQTIRWLGMTPAAMERMAARYGDLFRVRLLMPRHPGNVRRWAIGPTDVVIVHSPALFREVFAAGPELSGGEGRRFTATVFGERSLLVLDGEEHREERRRLLSLFAPERMDRYERLMRAAVEAALARWPTTGTVELGPLVNRLIVASSLGFVFGTTEHPAAQEIWGLMERVGELPDWSPPLLFFPALRRAAARWHPGLRTPVLLAAVRRALATLAQGAGPDTLYGHLLALESPDGDAAEWRLARMLGVMAGFDTTAVAAQWTAFHLLQHPAALERARMDDAFLEAACKEAARVQPAVPILVRRVVAPWRLAGHELQPGSFLVPCVYIIHHRPDLFPDPLAFRPERFLERSYGPHEFVPFGGGTRRCIGQSIAFRQIGIVLGAILRRFYLEPTRPLRQGTGRRAVVMTPRDPMPVRITRRG